LPMSAAATDTRQLTEIVDDFSGTLVIFATDEARLQASAEALAGVATLQVLKTGPGYLMLSTAAE